MSPTPLRDHLAEIVRLDNRIRELVRSTHVIPLSAINEFRQLKSERKYHVSAIQNAKAGQ